MKKFIFALLSVIVTFALNAKEPGNNLGKSLSTMRVLFPDLQYGWTEDGKDYYVQFDNDGYHKMTYYFVIQNNRVASESLIVEVNRQNSSCRIHLLFDHQEILYWRWLALVRCRFEHSSCRQCIQCAA